MLSVFPFLLSFGLLAPFLMRVTLGFLFIQFGYSNIFKKRNFDFNLLFIVSALEIIVGILLILGLFTQVVALISSLWSLFLIIKKISNKEFKGGLTTYILFFVMSLSLLVLGGGFFAIDLPL